MRTRTVVMHRRQRRGATLVFVAIMITVVVGMAAFAVDLSRFHVGANELQTGADAAALRGAMFLQGNPGTSPVDSAVAFATVNNALNGPVELEAGDVEAILWDPAASPSETSLGNNWTNANAVAVRASRTRGLLFGRLLGAVTSTPNRRAVAWVANITRVECPAPWGFPLNAFNLELFNANDFTVRTNSYNKLLDTLSNQSEQRRLEISMIFSPSDVPITTPANASFSFEAIDDNNVNMNAYRDQIADASSCAAASSVAIDSVEAFPGKGGGAIPKKTADGAHGGPGKSTGEKSLCEPVTKGGKANADCYPVGSGFTGSPGVTVTVAWIDDPTAKSSALVKTLSGFRVMCVYNGKTNGDPDPSETCAWYDKMRAGGYVPNTGMPNTFYAGTIIGYPVTLSGTLTPGTVLGNAPSLGQRLILVR